MASFCVTYHRHIIVFLFFLSVYKMCFCSILEEKKALALSNNLLNFVNNITNYTNIQEKFKNVKGEFVDIKGPEVVNLFTERLEKRFEEKIESLKQVKKHAEETTKPTLEETMSRHSKSEKDDGPYPYPNMRTKDNTSFAINPQFSLAVKVNMSKSYVHVPTNIYGKSDKVLNLAQWTESLDEVFVDNFNKSGKTLLYQYYGDHTGFLRVYPGNNNNYSEEIDLYDCRRRPWYVQATSSPKDLVIIIDFSGSMIGSNIGIAKIATASLIDTLEENDFFNVITVNKNVTYMEPCLKYLLQATKKNKERMKMLVQQAIGDPENELDHILGLETAFKLLNSGSEYNRSYASCNRAIMFITDGIESDYTKEKTLFKKFNADKSTRVFTYLVGRKKSPHKKALLQMACENTGYFYTLETLGNVWDTVLEYLHVMSRPLVDEKAKQKAMYTPVYLDSTGLGMIMSISMGVFSRKKSVFLGVAGTDITIKSLNAIIPHPQFGVFGHAFIITNNGFILMHPLLRLQTRSQPPPPNTLLEDVERAVDVDDIIEIKKSMIDQKPDQGENNTFPVYFLYDDKRKLSILNVTYSHKRINDTEFSVGVAIAEDERRQFNYVAKDDMVLSKGILSLKIPKVNMSIPNITVDNYTYITIAPWDYVNLTAKAQKTTPVSIKVYPTTEELFDYLKDIKTWEAVRNKVQTGRKLIANLLMSAGIVAEDSETWVPDEMKDDRETYESIFIATSAGYSRLFTYSNISKPYDRDILKTPIFEHALANPDAKVIFSAPYADRDNPPNDALITVIAPIRKDGAVLAVTGMRFKGELMRQHLENITGSLDENECKDNSTRICSLLDQNGYILASNLGPSYIGRFIGEQSSLLIEKLVDENVLKEIKLEDTQANCDWIDQSRASANILLTPAKLIFKSLIFMFRTLAGVGMQVGLFIVSMFQTQVSASSGDNPDIQVSCIRRLEYYIFQRDQLNAFNMKSSKEKTHNCLIPRNSRCRLEFEKIQAVQDTNLFYLEVAVLGGNDCPDDCRKPPKILTRTRIGDENYCVNDTAESVDKTQKYRRPPSTCFNVSSNSPSSTKAERKYACGGANFMKHSLWTLVIMICVCFKLMT